MKNNVSYQRPMKNVVNIGMENISETYRKNGWVGPIEVVSRNQAASYKKNVLKAMADLNLMSSDYRCKSNVLFPWVDEISRHPRLVECISQLIGPNYHCWDTLFWIKQPDDGRDVSFHQDATYWNFDKKHLGVTAWFAFDDATPEQGSIEYVNGSHAGQMRHKDVRTDTNLLMRGQTVDTDVPHDRVITTVPAGNVLIHSPFVIHGSGPNRGTMSRIAMGMVFASTECKPILDISPESTVMVSGVDHHNHMIHDPRPTGDWKTDLTNWKLAYDRQHANYYKMEQEKI